MNSMEVEWHREAQSYTHPQGRGWTASLIGRSTSEESAYIAYRMGGWVRPETRLDSAG